MPISLHSFLASPAHPDVCIICGREVGNRKYHFAPGQPSPSIALTSGTAPTYHLHLPTFRVQTPTSPCSYWSDGVHIVAANQCRCGRTFIIAELDPTL